MVSDETSLSPRLSSSCTIFDTVCSIRSGSTLRLRTVSSLSCTRSNVVKRKLQDRQTRRRRIAAESSVGRESFTCVSRLPHFGQRMSLVHLLPIFPFSGEGEEKLLINRKTRHQGFHLVTY